MEPKEIARIKANLQTLSDQGAPQADVDAYLKSEGISAEDIASSPVAGPNDPNGGEATTAAGHAFFVGTARGASFDTADEIGATMRGAAAKATGRDFQPTYDAALQTARENENILQKQHPWATGAGQAVGGVATALALRNMPGMTPAATMPGKIAQGALIGGATGGAYGFGGGEGGFVSRLQSAIAPTITGGALGAAFPPMAYGAATGINLAKNLLRISGPESRAVSLIGKAAERDAVPSSDIPLAIQSAGAKGVPLAPVDLGPNLTRLGRTVETIPGKGSGLATDFLLDRQAGQGGRLVNQVKNFISDPDQFWMSMDTLNQTRRLAAAPLYDSAYAKPAVDVWSPEIAGLMRRPSMKAAYQQAAKIAAEEGRDPKELGLVFDAAGDPVFLTGADKDGLIPSTQTMDYIKRGLDDVVEQFRDKTTGKLVLDEGGRAINNTRAKFVELLRTGNPDYAKALDAWAGPSHAMDVLSRARDWAHGDVEVSKKAFDALSPADQDLMRLGAARELKKLIDSGDDGVNKVRRIFGSQAKRDFLQMLFPDATSWEKFSAIMGAENQIAKNAQIIGGGSPTARIQAEQADTANVLMERFVTGGSRGAGMELVRRAFQGARGIDEATGAELAKRLFTTDPAAANALASELATLVGRSARRLTVRQQTIINFLTGANAAGSPLLPKPGDQGSLQQPNIQTMFAQALQGGAPQKANPYAAALMGQG
jgi:hypothetical protein